MPICIVLKSKTSKKSSAPLAMEGENPGMRG